MKQEGLNQKLQREFILKMGKKIYIIPSRTDTIELKEFMELLARTNPRNPLEKNLPQLAKGKEIAICLESISLGPEREESYLLNGQFETNVQSIREQLGKKYDVRQGIKPILEKGIPYLIEKCAVIKRR